MREECRRRDDVLDEDADARRGRDVDDELDEIEDEEDDEAE